MNTKLTLRLDDAAISRAKDYAKSSGKSISQIVSEYFALIQPRVTKPRKKPHGRITSQLYGSLKGHSVSQDDYMAGLQRKYR